MKPRMGVMRLLTWRPGRTVAIAAAGVLFVLAAAGGVVYTRSTSAQPVTATVSTTPPPTVPTPAISAVTPVALTSTPTPTATSTATPAPTPRPTSRPTPKPTPSVRECTAVDFEWSPAPNRHQSAGQHFSFETLFAFGPQANACVLPASTAKAWLVDSAGTVMSWCPVHTDSYGAMTAPPSPDESGGIGPGVELQCSWQAGATGNFTMKMALQLTTGEVVFTQNQPITAS